MVVWMMIIMRLLLVSLVAAANSPSPSSVDKVMCHPNERDALLSFKMAFSVANSSYFDPCVGRSHEKMKSWEKNGDCCKWNGVSCNSVTGHVVKLDLSCSLLNGSISSNTPLFRLPRLRYLSLSGNLLSGQVPPQIGWLSHLTTLDLSFNELKMPNFLTIITNMTDLRYLDLSFVSLDSNLPPFIFNFSKLAYIGLSGCSLRGEFPVANVNTSVAHIDLEYNMFSGVIPGWLFTQPSLSSVSLSHNMFMGISEFVMGNTSSLTSFDAKSNRLQGQIPDGIFDLHNLQLLYLDGNNLTGTILLSRIQKLQSMQWLTLSDNSLSVIDDTITDN